MTAVVSITSRALEVLTVNKFEVTTIRDILAGVTLLSQIQTSELKMIGNVQITWFAK